MKTQALPLVSQVQHAVSSIVSNCKVHHLQLLRRLALDRAPEVCLIAQVIVL